MTAAGLERARAAEVGGHPVRLVEVDDALVVVTEVLREKVPYTLALPAGSTPSWAWKLLAPLYLHSELDERPPSPGDVIPLAEPVAGFTGLLLVADPDVDGATRIVGLYDDELTLIETWDAHRFIEAWLEQGGDLITTEGRTSWLTGDFGVTCRAQARAEGSSVGQLYFDGGWSETDDEGLALHLPGGEEAARIQAILRARLPFERPLFLVGPPGAGTVAFIYDANGFRAELQDDTLAFFGRCEDQEIQQLVALFDPDGPGVTVPLG